MGIRVNLYQIDKVIEVAVIADSDIVVSRGVQLTERNAEVVEDLITSLQYVEQTKIVKQDIEVQDTVVTEN